MKRLVVAGACGLLFGTSLAVAGVGDPRTILGFLDVTGDFRPQVAGVIGAALLLNLVLWPRVLRRERPWLDDAFALPTRKDIDAQLLGGSCLFGVGWGLSGYCAGPALSSLVASTPAAALYLGALICGYVAHDFTARALAGARLAKVRRASA